MSFFATLLGIAGLFTLCELLRPGDTECHYTPPGERTHRTKAGLFTTCARRVWRFGNLDIDDDHNPYRPPDR